MKIGWQVYLVLAVLGLFSTACAGGVESTPLQPVNPLPVGVTDDLLQACQNAGGTYVPVAENDGGQDDLCVFADNAICPVVELISGVCRPDPQGGVILCESCDASPAVTPTPFPTKVVEIPATPIVKGADPFPTWATYLNDPYDIGFRYPDSWLVEDLPNRIRLIRDGVELTIFVRSPQEELTFMSDLPYAGVDEPGNTVSFYDLSLVEQRRMVENRIMAVVYAGDGFEVNADNKVFAIRLVSLQSDAVLSEALLQEVQELLSSFEPWTN
jgi:putative hemolysin